VWSYSSGYTRRRFYLEKDEQLEFVNSMSAKFQAIEKLSFVISNDFYDSLVFFVSRVFS
jgi:hypothetical protein